MKILEILKNQMITNQFDFSGSCPDKDGVSQTFSIFSTAFFLSELRHNYFNRVAFTDLDGPFADLVSEFTIWAQQRGPMYARMMYAYSLGYNPIENYSSIEKHTGHDDYENHKKITHTWSQDKLEREYTNFYNETTHTGDKDTTTYSNYTETDKNYRLGVNSGTKQQQSEYENTKSGSMDVEHKGSRKDETSGKYSDTHTGSYNDENSGTDKTVYNSQLERSGNIGVMTASQMLQSQYDGLIQDLQQRALKEFLDKYSFYDGEVDI